MNLKNITLSCGGFQVGERNNTMQCVLMKDCRGCCEEGWVCAGRAGLEPCKEPPAVSIPWEKWLGWEQDWGGSRIRVAAMGMQRTGTGDVLWK